MRFIGDVPIGRVTIEWLEQRGHDCVSLRSRLPSNAPDADIVAIARKEGRVILCFDLDFSAILALSPATARDVGRDTSRAITTYDS